MLSILQCDLIFPPLYYHDIFIAVKLACFFSLQVLAVNSLWNETVDKYVAWTRDNHVNQLVNVAMLPIYRLAVEYIFMLTHRTELLFIKSFSLN